MVNVYESTESRLNGGPFVARVRYNENLDHWDGSNWSNGGVGQHLGITRLRKSGKMVIIYGSNRQNSINCGITVTDDVATSMILSNNADVIKKYPHLQKIAEELDTDE